MKRRIEGLFDSFVKENHLDIKLSYCMPNGYQDAFGTFDIAVQTLYLNAQMLESKPAYETLFYFYHELRHAVQYTHPERFDKAIQESIHYVILYNGNCFKLVDREWKTCHLSGDEAYFILAYKNLPYELDANRYARDTVMALLPPHRAEIELLYRSWSPQRPLPFTELKKIFLQIDQAT